MSNPMKRGSGSEPAADSVEALSETVAQLRAERDGLRRAMRNRSVIEQAKGVLAERLDISPEAAFERIVERSSQSNVKVADLAAAIVSGHNSSPPTVAEAAPASISEVDSTDTTTPVELPANLNTLRAELPLIASHIESAQSYNEIAEALTAKTVGWAEPDHVLVMLIEPDGALRLAGHAGLSPTTRSQWERVPPIDNVPVFTALRDRAPLYLPDAEAVQQQFPSGPNRTGEALFAMPLIHQGRTIGAVELTWKTPPRMDKETREHLFTLAATTAQRCDRLSHTKSSSTSRSNRLAPTDANLLPLFMTALSRPALLLIPQFDSGRIVDFIVQAANPGAQEAATAEKLSSSSNTLLKLLPHMGSQRFLTLLTSVFNSGEPYDESNVRISADAEGTRHSYQVDIHVARVWDRVMLTWRYVTEAEQLHEPLLYAESAFDTGAFWWSAATNELRWSAGMFRLTGADPSQAAPPIDTVTELIHPDDREKIVHHAESLLRDGTHGSVTIRGAGACEGNSYELSAQAFLGTDGTLVAVYGACRLAKDEEAAGGSGAAAPAPQADSTGFDADSAVAAALAPLPATSNAEGILVSGISNGPGAHVCGSWYDTVQLSDSAAMLIVGEVHGDASAASLLRLRYAATAYAVAGKQPHELLQALNDLACIVEPGRTASACVARVDLDSADIVWAASGQAAPIFFRPDRSANIRSGALGMPIGATTGITFASNDAHLDAGEQMILYTESMMNRNDVSLSRMIEAMLTAAEATTPA
ncbi:MAG TPA: ANTAR domain-containing protein, partial [Candidatus Stackebrandtia faecavium]|nr:ANTAR domain-containing protein [Candidatus Stackebrandtia faecavium]